MAKTTSCLPALLFLLLLVTKPDPSHSLSYSQLKTLISHSHSLLTRVANLRASRGDHSGSHRARLIAQRLEPGLGLGSWGAIWSLSWDYLKNYAWRELDYTELYEAVKDVNELMSRLGELTRIESEGERAAWVGRNYKNVLTVCDSLLRKLMKVFWRSGALREVVETVKVEVVKGELLKDCLELGSGDLQGLLQVLKDLASQFYYTSRHNSDL